MFAPVPKCKSRRLCSENKALLLTQRWGGIFQKWWLRSYWVPSNKKVRRPAPRFRRLWYEVVFGFSKCICHDFSSQATGRKDSFSRVRDYLRIYDMRRVWSFLLYFDVIMLFISYNSLIVFIHALVYGPLQRQTINFRDSKPSSASVRCNLTTNIWYHRNVNKFK